MNRHTSIMLLDARLHQDQKVDDRPDRKRLGEEQANVPREKRNQAIAEYALMISTLFILGDIMVEQSTYPMGNVDGMYLAYLAVPFFILSVFVTVYAYSYRCLKIAWRNPMVRLSSVLVGVGYAIVYIFATDMVGAPVPMPPNLPSLISTYQVYDHLTVWPSVFFWYRPLNLYGDFSVGNVLVVSALALLTTFTVALLVHNVKRKLDRRSAGSFAGSFIVSLLTSASGCCTPVILPALFAFFGLASTTSPVQDFAFQTSPVFNLLWIGNIWLLLVSVLLSSDSGVRIPFTPIE